MDSDPACDLKDGVEIAKNCFEILGFLLVGLYFFYQLLAGFFVPCRLGVELTCDTPFRDKNLVRSTLTLKNTGDASVRITDARLWAFKLDPSKRIEPDWPCCSSHEKSEFAVELERDQLAFQRLSVNLEDGRLVRRQAEEPHDYLNLETKGEQERQFVLFGLKPALYRMEFRLQGVPMFGRDVGFIRNISNALFPLSRYSQWVATAVIQVPGDRGTQSGDFDARGDHQGEEGSDQGGV